MRGYRAVNDIRGTDGKDAVPRFLKCPAQRSAGILRYENTAHCHMPFSVMILISGGDAKRIGIFVMPMPPVT